MKRLLVTLLAAGAAVVTAVPHSAVASSPIQHVVVIYQENHSFDNALGEWCAQTGHCRGIPATVTLAGGIIVTPHQAPDVVPQVVHSVASQVAAMDGGKMDGWASINGCAATTGYACISYYSPSQIPNEVALAQNFAISDATFSMADSPSWGGHMYAVAASTDGFTGNNPVPAKGVTPGPGWGCDSKKVATWIGSGVVSLQPSCVPDPALGLPNGGAFRPTLAQYVPTIMDRLDAAGLSWRLYSPSSSQPSYVWATCPTFAECLNTQQRNNVVPGTQLINDANAGTLANYSLVNGMGATSQHNGQSMAVGDNYIGQMISALENGPEWSSTAVFITYDDCGCFYDHVKAGINPDGTQQGPRVPLVIVSPYARPGYVDSTPTSFAGILAFVEQMFNLSPLSLNDARAYPFSHAFDYTRPHLAPVMLAQHPVPPGEVIVNTPDPT